MKKHLTFCTAIAIAAISNVTYGQTGNWKLAGNVLNGSQLLGSTNSVDLKIITNNSIRMTIRGTNGLVGVGNLVPLYQLDVLGTTRFQGNMGIQTAPNSRTLQVGATQGSLMGIGTAEYLQDAGTSTLSLSGSFVPVTNGSYSLGNGSNKWSSVWSVNGSIQTSDERDKTNIKDLGYGLKEILQLRAIKFNWKDNIEEGEKLGFVAQQLQKVMPEVVRDWDYEVDEKTGKKTKKPTEKLGVMYADIIPVLIHAIQEQQKQIEDLTARVNQPPVAVTDGSSALAVNNISLADASLDQNTPNPAKNSTAIRYTANGKAAQLIVTDANGKAVKQAMLAAKGAAMIHIDCSALAAGTYQYTLMVDGKFISSKKMVVVK